MPNYNAFGISKSFLPGGGAKAITAMTSGERKASLKLLKKTAKTNRSEKHSTPMNVQGTFADSYRIGPRKIKDTGSRIRDIRERRELGSARRAIERGKFKQTGTNIHVSGYNDKAIKELQSSGALPKRAKRPVYIDRHHTASAMDAFKAAKAGQALERSPARVGFTGHIGGKKSPSYVTLHTDNNSSYNKYLLAHEFTHANTKRTAGRLATFTSGKKKGTRSWLREEARADATATKKVGSHKVAGAPMSVYANQAQAVANSEKRGIKGILSRATLKQGPLEIPGASSPGFKEASTGDFKAYNKMRRKLGAPIEPATRRGLANYAGLRKLSSLQQGA
jgi:hypothetical protein